MDDLPADLLRAIPAASLAVAQQWWGSLPENDRLEVAALWDRRLEVYFFTPQADEDERLDAWEAIPQVRRGCFVPHDDAWGLSEWGPGYFEHLLQHPELMLLWEPAERRLHIGCTVHASARACLDLGEIPPSFACPFGSVTCPMMPLRGAILAKRRSEPRPPR